MFCDVMLAAEQVKERAEGLAADLRTTHDNAAQQAGQVMDAAAATEEMSTGAAEISSGTDESTRAVERVREYAEDGQQAVCQNIGMARHLVDAVGDSERKLQRASQSVHEISSVASLFAEIAEQTNLLALNAAIKAARAGE
ncbi:Methyl-accepting chemotaxis domain-containing protein [Aromatoleum petrolei]|nr:Methyl-accepting chemotaxis domain-containing protein [Aromatoleum petrolei]